MSVAELVAEVKEYKLQLETVVSGLQADPDNIELQNLQTELEEFISLTESSIAELKPKPVSTPPPPESPSTEKWSKENHPAFQTGYRRPGAPPVQIIDEKDDQLPGYKVNDTVLAKWKSGDRSFYPAKITSITGSSTKPVYIVTFKGYGNTETVFSHEIRPAQNQQAGQKRKAEEAIGSGSGNTSSTNTGSGITSPTQLPLPGVISAATTVDPALATAARNGQDQASLKRENLDGAQKSSKTSKKMSSQKALEGAQSKWQSFQGSKGKFGKGGKKFKGESMFRTGEGMNAKVGFIGSGQAMRKDQARTRHVYDTGNDEDY